MIYDVVIDGQPVRFDDSDDTMKIAHGGEANVFDCSSLFPGECARILFSEFSPQFDTDELRDIQIKRKAGFGALIDSLPKGLPKEMLMPVRKIYDPHGVCIGYTMQLIKGAMTLPKVSWSQTRKQFGLKPDYFRNLLIEKHRISQAAHDAGVVLGDDNPDNWLVVPGTMKIYRIDNDAIQFGSKRCEIIHQAYIDPRICVLNAEGEFVLKPGATLGRGSDTYAEALIVWEILTSTLLYGGTDEEGLTAQERTNRRMPIFHPGIQFPKGSPRAISTDRLPDEFLDYYKELVYKDRRGEFPIELLEYSRWNECTGCKKVHARPVCPCGIATPNNLLPPSRIKEKRGQVIETKLFETPKPGQIIGVQAAAGKYVFLHHWGSQFYRGEFAQNDISKKWTLNIGKPMADGNIDPRMVLDLQGDSLIQATGNSVWKVGTTVHTLNVDSFQGVRPVFAASSAGLFWMQEGQLFRNGTGVPTYIGSAPKGRTMIWSGPAFGFGISFIGSSIQAFTFDARQPGLNSVVGLPSFSGSPVSANCMFTDRRCWLFLTTNNNGRLTRWIVVVNPEGMVDGKHSVPAGTEQWLENTHGKVPATLASKKGPVHGIYAVTPKGLMLYTLESGKLVPKNLYPDFLGKVVSNEQLVFNPTDSSIISVGARSIKVLTFKSA